jgi:trigger factor
VKITTEKLPKSILALDIELDNDQVEKGLDRAARRLSQKYSVPGFRKGKAPRFIIENYFGRDTLMEEASDDLINKSFRHALEQEQIKPVGPPTLEDVHTSDEAFRFRVMVPVPPSITLPDYRSIRKTLEVKTITDEDVQRAMDEMRDKHAVLRELDEPRPAQHNDQLTVKLQTFVEDEPLEEFAEGEEIPDSTLVMETQRLVPELYEGLLGASIDEEHEIVAQMPEDHPNERVSGKEVTFKVRVVGIQERVLPDWDELPVLEEFEGTIDELRARTRENLEHHASEAAEKNLIDDFVDEVVANTSYDVPDVMIEDSAQEMLEEYGQQFTRFGITLDQMLQYRNQTREQVIEEMLPEAEERLKTRLALLEMANREDLNIFEDEVQEEANTILGDLDEQTINALMQQQELTNQLLTSVANSVLNRKLRERIRQIAMGEAPELAPPEQPDETQAAATDAPASLPAPDEAASSAASTDEPAAVQPATPETPAETGSDTEQRI